MTFPARPEAPGRGGESLIAVIGLSGRFPGAGDVEQFWDNLVQGRDCITRLGGEALQRAGVLTPGPTHVPAEPVLDDIDQFDAAFFHISPREAATLTPVIRLLLECCWEAFETAACVPAAAPGPVGVFVGANLSQYWRLGSQAMEPSLEEILGNDKDYLATHIAYRLNLKGPALSVQTACSTSLVAVHMAADALIHHRCDLALAGGGAVRIPHATGYWRSEGSILSPDGVCRPFDGRASGPVFGSGVGVVLLKRLQDALADGDPIRAVIRGSAVNNDGAGKPGFTAPSVEGQAAVIAQALASAGTPARSISYIEAHGTATALGDPVEVAALTRTFRQDTAERAFCAIGSVKGNVGHLETAAGVTGLIKTILALEHRELPPSLHFECPNPEIDFGSSPFFVNTRRRAWPREGEAPRRAGVSSFGMGGTNAHVVVEEAPAEAEAAAPADPAQPHLLRLSAPTPTALARIGHRLADHLRRHPALQMADVALALAVGRERFELRRAVVAASAAELGAALAARPAFECVPRQGTARRAGLWFSGPVVCGPLAHALYRDEPGFRDDVDACIRAGGWSEVARWFAQDLPGDTGSPALAFAVQYGLTQWWRAWGLRPSACASSIEQVWVAACVAGLLPLEQATRMVGAGWAGLPSLPGLTMGPSGTHLPLHVPQMARCIGPGEGFDTALWRELGEPLRTGAASEACAPQEGAECWVDLGVPAQAQAGVFGLPVADLPLTGRFAARRALLHVAARLWMAGIELDAHGRAGARRPVLPTYPFERQRFWVEAHAASLAAPVAAVAPVPAAATVPAPPLAARVAPDLASVVHTLCDIVGEALHLPPRQIDVRRDFIAMGADSLVLIEAVQALQRRFGIKVPVRDIFETLTSVEALAGFIVDALGRQVAAAPGIAEPQPMPVAAPAAAVPAPPPRLAEPAPAALNSRQQAHLQALIGRYTGRSAGSKRMASAKRPLLSDVRSSAGFKLFIKEMLYPIVAESGAAGHVVDVDGNDYVDVTQGFGVRLFGHRAPFLDAALRDHLQRDPPLGPENLHSEAVARLITAMTGVERIGIFSTGTEAVMTALRVVRAHSGRSRIAMFKGSYHGHADATLGIGMADGRAAPLSAGIPAATLEHLMVLEYGSDASLRLIEQHAHELAAVIVEPVQSRYPDHQPAVFLHALRRLTAAHGVALVFDEMITGFRIGPGGAQAWFGVQADVLTYGKVVGGGLPIGVLAGKAEWLDGLDGGDWRYGDQSYPAQATIFYAGTYNKNPWTMAAARATLEEIERQGPALYTRLNCRTARLATTLNAFFCAQGLPIEVVHFASLFRFNVRSAADLFFFHMIERGVYVWEGRNCFVCDAHTEADLQRIVTAAQDSALALREGGFLDAGPAVCGASHPLTEAQRQLLLADQLSPDGLLAYTIHLTAVLSGGPVDAAALELALAHLVQRHPALRTVFPPGGQVQQVRPHVWVPLQPHDVSMRPAGEREAAYGRWFADAACQRFDLAQGPLLRAHLVCFDTHEHRLVLSLPHLIADGISLNILLGDLIELYTLARQSRMPQLAPATPFSAQVEWLEHQVASGAFSVHERYWRAQLAGPLPALSLPTDHPRAARADHAAGVARLVLDPALAAALRRMGQVRRATLFMTCLSAWLLLLHRLSGEADLIVGVPTAGRALEGSETLVGYCTHLLPIRSRLAGAPSFEAHLQQVRSLWLEAFEHQGYPFAHLLRALDLAADPGRSPLLSATFNLDQPPAWPAMDGLAVRMTAPPVLHTSYELALNITDIDAGLVLECKYHRSLFAAPRMAILLAQYQAVLAQVAQDPAVGVFDIDLAQVPGAVLPDPALPLPEPEYPLPAALVLRRGAEAPRQPALISATGCWTYGELAQQATRVAQGLRLRGVAPGDRVAIEGPRDGRLVCALLGIWLCGGVFVTLDESLPAARRQAILRASGARLLLNHWPQASTSVTGEVQALHLPPGSDWPQDEAAPPLPVVLPGDPAYVFFTSGSTGAPKGILGLHKGVAQFVAWQSRCFQIGPQDRVAQLTSLSFDALLREIFLPLSCGATLHLPQAAELGDAARLVDWLAREQITVLHTVPTRARTWIAAAPAGALPALRRVFFSGEPLTHGLVDAWRGAFGAAATLVNFYGSTETTMIRAYRVIDAPGAEPVPPGAVFPIADTQLLVLRGTRPCGIGEPGEIVVRTPFRTAGDLQGGALQTFAANPWVAGERFYRSGDLGRHRPDGSVEVLGRLDDRLKIRGVRVEPAEVKAVLDAHPSVANSAVLARPGPQGPELVAYVVPGAAAGPGLVEAVRGVLAASLPAAAVPRAIVLLPALPLLPNGKVDRLALPEPLAAAARVAVPPRNPTEQRLLDAWHEVLEDPALGVTDNVFEFGANSLSATRVVSRIRQDFGLELPLPALFEHATVQALAHQIALLHTVATLLDTRADPDPDAQDRGEHTLVEESP